MNQVFSKFNRIAVITVSIAVISVVVGFGISITMAVTWQDPTAVPPNLGSLEPPLNNSIAAQEKTGGLNLATRFNTSLVVGDNVSSLVKFLVRGSSYFDGDTEMDSLDVSGNTDINSIYTGQIILANDLNINNGFFKVDSVVNHVLVNTDFAHGLVTINAENEAGIDSESTSSNPTVGAANTMLGGTAVYGYATTYGISSVSQAGYGVLADASAITSDGGLYARGRDGVSGIIGMGLYAVVGLDNTEDINDPVFNGSGTTLAGLFEGSVDVIPSTGGYSDLVVDTNTFVVRSLNNKVGIGTNNPVVKLHVIGESNLPTIHSITGTNISVGDDDGHNDPTLAVSGVYGQGGTVTYSGAGTGWNFGVFGKAGNPGTGRSVGIMGIEGGVGGDTYAGWFEGDFMVNGLLDVAGRIKVESDLEMTGDMLGVGDLNLVGTNSDINLTGTASNIDLTGSVDGEGNITYIGKLIMDGGLPAMEGGTTCNVAPGSYAEGTMYICNWCPTPTTARRFVIRVRMGGIWKDIGNTSGAPCGNPYIPENPKVDPING